MTAKYVAGVVFVTALVLLIPLISMQFSDGVVWTLSDFVFAAALISGTGIAYKFISQRSTAVAYRVATAIAVVTALLLVWVNGAVGIIGSDDNPVNLLYFVVLVIGLIGVFLSRLEADGMKRALVVTGIAQILVPIIALEFRPSDFDPGLVRVFGLNIFFVLLWLVSALLYRRVAQKQSEQLV